MAATINASTSPAGIVQTADGTGILALQTAGTTAVTIDASQNVGIGTATPVRMLDVSKTTGDAGVAITSSTTGQSSIFFADTDTNVGMIYYEHTNDAMGFRTNDAERMRIDSSGNLLFNSGYGSVATAYGCRAWVNFNGTGTVAIRASGNVSSITDNGTGDYTVNFTTAIVDTNYATNVTGEGASSANASRIATIYALGTTSAVRMNIYNPSVAAFQDVAVMNVSAFR